MTSMTVTASGVSDTIRYEYDALQRLTAKTTSRTGLTLAQTSAYKTVSGNRTSTLISGVTQKVNGSTTAIRMTASAISRRSTATGAGSAMQLIPGFISAKHFVNNASKSQLEQFASNLGYLGRNYKQASEWTGKIVFDATKEFSDKIPGKIVGNTVTWA